MSFDISRIRFDPREHFLGVIMQQGRVQVDSEWNEWVAQLVRRLQAGSADTFGWSAVPRATTPDGFRIEAAGGNIRIWPGRIYVDGLLAENHGAGADRWSPRLEELAGESPVDFLAQPYFVDQPPLPATPGPHLVYLDVWRRDVSHLQEPDLVEKAIGVDTTGRVQTVWQVKVLEDVGPITRDTPLEDIPGWEELTSPSPGRLSTGTGQLSGEVTPCEVPPAAGYTGLENQLYRVEIHTPGGPGTATFKWSRDNATVATRVTHITPSRTKLTVESTGRDDVLRFNDGDWVEITDDNLELRNEPGQLRRIRVGGGVDDATRTIELDTALPAGVFPVNAQEATDPSRNTRIRRWDQAGQVRKEDGSSHVDLDDSSSTGEIPVPPAGTRLFLENGILVDFSLAPAGEAPSREFKSGDHWVFAARIEDASVESLDKAPPRGIHHHFAPLARVTLPEDEQDFRNLWPAEGAGESCACTVCVHPDTHNDGTATIQQAVDSLLQSGGTVCLAPGSYLIQDPILLRGANSVRLRGHGATTVLLRESPGPVIEVSRASEIAIEDLSLYGTAGGSGTTAMVSVSNTSGFRLEHTSIHASAVDNATSVAVELSGYALLVDIFRNLLVAEQGIVGARGRSRMLATTEFQASQNVFSCTQRGVSFEEISLHSGSCNISNNLIAGCSHAGVLALGGVTPGASFTISENLIQVSGDGIRAGVDGLRIYNNEILPEGRSGNGIVLEPGADLNSIPDLRIIGNRIQGMDGHGIAIRQRVENGMIKQNTLANLGISAIVMEQAGSASHLVIENNHLLNIGLLGEKFDFEYAGVQLIAVDRVDIINNVIGEVGRTASLAPATFAVMAGHVGEFRATGNRLYGIGPDQGTGWIAGFRILPPGRHLSMDNNTITRTSDQSQSPSRANWYAIHVVPTVVHGSPASGPSRTGPATVSLTYANQPNGLVLVTETSIYYHQIDDTSVSVRGNGIEGQLTEAPLVHVMLVDSCLFAGNHCRLHGDNQNFKPTTLGLLGARLLNASNNHMIGFEGQQTLSLVTAKKRGAVVVGNISTGDILLEGAPLPPPWDNLNLLGMI